MAIQCRLRCSECTTIRDVVLKSEDRDITCPVCGRRIQNLTAEEHREVETVQKKQQLFAIISFVFLALAVTCVILWIGGAGDWLYKVTPSADLKIPASISPPNKANDGFFFGAIVCFLVTLVLGILGSLKRFVVEF